MHTPGGGSEWEGLFWLLFARSANPIALLDDHRRFVDVNDPMLALLARERSEVIGSSIVESIRPDEREQAASEWEGFLRSGEYSGTRAFLRPDGSEVVVDFAARLASIEERHLATYVITLAGDSGHKPPVADAGAGLLLSTREREVITLIALGHGTREIAGQLHISTETVRTHVRNAMAKLGVHTRAQLVAVVLCGESMIELPHPGE